VRLLVEQEELRRLLLSICVARIAKNNIREQMRLASSHFAARSTDVITNTTAHTAHIAHTAHAER
jgi:hypothetical protein